MVVVDHLVLFMPEVFLDLPIVVEEDPFDEVIEGFTFAGSGLYRFPHLNVGDVLVLCQILHQAATGN